MILINILLIFSYIFISRPIHLNINNINNKIKLCLEDNLNNYNGLLKLFKNK